MCAVCFLYIIGYQYYINMSVYIYIFLFPIQVCTVFDATILTRIQASGTLIQHVDFNYAMFISA